MHFFIRADRGEVRPETLKCNALKKESHAFAHDMLRSRLNIEEIRTFMSRFRCHILDRSQIVKFGVNFELKTGFLACELGIDMRIDVTTLH